MQKLCAVCRNVHVIRICRSEHIRQRSLALFLPQTALFRVTKFIVYVCLTYRIEMLVCLLIFKCLISSINFEPNKKPRISKSNAFVAIAISNKKLIDIWRLKSETKMRKRQDFCKAKLSFDFIVLELNDKSQIQFCPHCYIKNEQQKCKIDKKIPSNSNTENE